MRTTRLIGVLLLLAVGNWPTCALAFVDTTASWRFTGGALARHLHVNDSQRLDAQGSSMTLANVDKPILLAATSNIFGGFAKVEGNLKATAGIGHLHATLRLELYAENEIPVAGLADLALADVDAEAAASWRDSVTITLPGLPQGFPLLVPAQIYSIGVARTQFPNTPGTGCCGFGSSGVTIRTIDGTFRVDGNSSHNLPAIEGDSDLDLDIGPHVDVLRFQNGVPHDIGYILKVTGRGYADRGQATISRVSTGSVTTLLSSDFGNTVTWGGIAGVFNAETGEPVENWTMVSESGFDYTRPYEVPEPASLLFIGLALCCSIGLRARR